MTTEWVKAPAEPGTSKQETKAGFQKEPVSTQALVKEIFGLPTILLPSLKIQKVLAHSPVHHKNHELLLSRIHLW